MKSRKGTSFGWHVVVAILVGMFAYMICTLLLPDSPDKELQSRVATFVAALVAAVISALRYGGK